MTWLGSSSLGSLGYSQAVNAAGIISRLDWGRRILFQVNSRGCWQEGPVPHHADLSPGLLECPQDKSAPPEQMIQERRRTSKHHSNQGGSHSLL